MAMQVATLAGARTGVPDDAVDELRASLRGELLTPSDPGYAGLRPEFNAMHRAEPALAVSCSGTADVIAAVNFAREQKLKVAVRGGATRSPGCPPPTAGC